MTAKIYKFPEENSGRILKHVNVALNIKQAHGYDAGVNYIKSEAPKQLRPQVFLLYKDKCNNDQ
jgi:hypothetical protein